MAVTTLGGTLNFVAGGVPYALAGTFTYDIGGVEREMRVGPNGVNGFTQKFRAPMVDVEFQDSGQVTAAQIQSIAGQTVVISLDNGKVVTMYQASQVGDLVTDAIEAKIKTKLGAISATEFTP